MTSDERSELAQLNVRLFGLEGTGGAIGAIDAKVDRIEVEVAEWRGAIRLVRAGATLLGIGGIVTILTAILKM